MGYTNSTYIEKNGKIRICDDFKVTLNKFLHVERYPLLRIKEMFSKFYGAEEFTKLDLSMAYQQIGLDQASRKYTTISKMFLRLLSEVDFKLSTEW